MRYGFFKRLDLSLLSLNGADQRRDELVVIQRSYFSDQLALAIRQFNCLIAFSRDELRENLFDILSDQADTIAPQPVFRGIAPAKVYRVQCENFVQGIVRRKLAGHGLHPRVGCAAGAVVLRERIADAGIPADRPVAGTGSADDPKKISIQRSVNALSCPSDRER